MLCMATLNLTVFDGATRLLQGAVPGITGCSTIFTITSPLHTHFCHSFWTNTQNKKALRNSQGHSAKLYIMPKFTI